MFFSLRYHYCSSIRNKFKYKRSPFIKKLSNIWIWLNLENSSFKNIKKTFSYFSKFFLCILVKSTCVRIKLLICSCEAFLFCNVVWLNFESTKATTAKFALNNYITKMFSWKKMEVQCIDSIEIMPMFVWTNVYKLL